MGETTNAIPNPGTWRALSKGCTCPVIDNAHGKGYMGRPNVFVYTVGCPLHDGRKPQGETSTANEL